MRLCTRAIAAIGLIAVSLWNANLLTAQPVQGRDIIVTTAGTTPGVFYMDKTQPVIGTILVNNNGFANWVEMWDDNIDLSVCHNAGPGGTAGLWRVDLLGGISSISGAITGTPNHAFLDEDGDSFLVAATVFNLVYDVPNVGGGYTTLILVNNGFANSMCVDPDTGDVIVGGSTSYPAAPTPPTPGTGFLLRYDRNSGMLKSTLATGLLRVSSVYPDYEQGGFFVARFDQGGILRVDNQGGVTTVLASNTRNNSVRVDSDGTLWSVDVGDITHFDRTGTIIRRLTLPLAMPGLTGLAIYGNRRLVARGEAKPGQSLRLDIQTNDPNETGKNYVMAASFATRPGFKIAGRFIALSVDNLFILTAQNLAPTIFQNFTGQINALGQATAFINLPASFPANTGIRVHVHGLILDPNAPGGVAETLSPVHFALK